jgi:hypothetical protein
MRSGFGRSALLLTEKRVNFACSSAPHNDEPLYRQKVVIFRALAKKRDRGKYSPALAPKAFASLTGVAAKKYVREFGGPGDRWNVIFSPIDRRQAAAHFAEEFLEWYAVDYERPARKS